MITKNFKKIVAELLILAMLLSSISMGLTACGSPERIDVSRLTAPEKLLFSEDFSNVLAGAIPEGWDKTYPYPFLKDADKSTCLETEGGNKTHITVRKNEDESALGFLGRNGANIVTIPRSYEGDWVMSFDVNFKSFATPFGVAVGLAEKNEEAGQATLFTLSGKEKKVNGEIAYQPIFSIYNRVKGGGDFVGRDKNRTDLVAADIIPDSVIINDKKSGTGTISNTEIINIQIYRYSGVYYLYANGKLVGDIDDAQTGNRIGFYSDTQGREVQISNVTIHSINYAPEVDSKVFKLETLTETDFKDADSLKGWKLLGDYAGEGANGILEANLLKSGRTSLYRAPVFDSKNAVITAEITPKTEGVSFGAVTNISATVSNSKKGFGVMVDTASSKLRSLSMPQTDNLSEFDVKELLGFEIKTGEVCKLKIYLFEGDLYLFVNDTFAFRTAIPTVSHKQYCGIVVSGGSAELNSFKIENAVKRGVVDDFALEDSDISLQDDKVVLGLSGKISLTAPLVAYDSPEGEAEYGFVMAEKGNETVTVETEGAIVLKATSILKDRGVIRPIVQKELSDNDVASKSYKARGYIAISEGDEKVYFYGEEKMINPAAIASNIYLKLTEQKDKDLLDTLFKDAESYIGKYEKTITFGLFSDFHYKFGMYSTSVADMEAIFERANKAGAAFMLSGGDMCNDFKGSPEITNAFLNNKYNIPAYNVYGNHELEAKNTMQDVTPLLTNDKNVVWGTKDGKIGDGSIAYYYADREGFRIVCVDTNYSYNSQDGWEHNETGSYGPPEGNIKSNSLGPVQRQWLEEVLTDAANNSIPCIIIGHATMSSNISGAAGDAEEVRNIYNKVNAIRKGTVLMSINGHYHTNRMFESESVLYIDMNTTRNGVWRGTGDEHYGANHTFEQIEYDMNGNPVATRNVSLGSLTMGKNTWFFEDPLSAVVTISQYGSITVEGMESRWIYGVNPTSLSEFEMPLVSSGNWDLVKK